MEEIPRITLFIRNAIEAAQRSEGKSIYSVRMFGKADKDLLIKTMKEKGGLTARKADIEAVLGALGEAVVFLGEMGLATELPGFGTFFVSAKGVLDKDNNPVAGKERRLRIRFRPSRSISVPIVTNVVTSTAKYDPVMPIIQTFSDAGTGEKNSQLTPGGIAGLSGKNLRFDPTKADEGLWLVPSDPEGVEVKIAQVLTNDPSKLTFLIPSELPEGAIYGLRIQTRIKGSKVLRTALSLFNLVVVV